MTNAGHEDRMLLALDPAALVNEFEPVPEDRPRVPRSRNASHGRIIDHFLTKLESFDETADGIDVTPFAARLYQDI